ncbi:MAG: sterol desaturase family protein [Chitinophagaceae bacterium]
MNKWPDVSNPLWFFIVSFIVYIIVLSRYFIFSWFFYSVFYIWHKEKWKSKKINHKEYKAGQFKKEIIRSNLSAILFGISGAVLLLLWQKGYSKIYVNVYDYNLWWIPVSLITALILQETYYYWLHRWMHIPSVFRLVHKWHHESHIASPWTAFSFHPLEAVIQAIFFPLLFIFLPMNLYLLIVILTIMSVSSVINHLDIEIYPKWLSRNVLGRGLIGATHHSLHHKQYKYNYGLYFTWWDKLSKTESPVYEDEMEKNQSSDRE